MESERREDILPICEYYLDHFNKNKKYKFTLSSNSKTKLELYDWPGNTYLKLQIMLEKTIILNQSFNSYKGDFEIRGFAIRDG